MRRLFLSILILLFVCPAFGAVRTPCIYPQGTDKPSNLYGARYSGNSCYTTMALMEAGEQANLTAAGDILYCEIVSGITTTWGNTAPSGISDYITTPIIFFGWTTGANNYIVIDAMTGASMSAISAGSNVTGARHSGKWDTAVYTIVAGSGSYGIQNQQTYTRIRGVQIYLGAEFSSQTGLWMASGSGGSVADGVIVRKNSAASSASDAGFYADSTLETYFINSVVADMKGTSGKGINMPRTSAGTTIYAYNNTFVNCTTGFYQTWADSILPKNNIVNGGTWPATTNKTFPVGTSYNSTNLASFGYTVSGGSVGDVTGTAPTFVNAAGYDFHLQSTDTAALNLGTDLSADAKYPFSTDIDLATRTVSWCIGADELDGGAPPAVTPRKPIRVMILTDAWQWLKDLLTPKAFAWRTNE